MHKKVFNLDIISFHSWRQTQTQSTIQSFYEEDFNILNPRRNARGNGDGIERMEFPIMQWIFSAFYKMFGNKVIITRILSFLIGIFSTIGIYKLVYILFNKKEAAIIGAWAFAFSPIIYYYTMNPMPDNFALMCSIYGLYYFFLYYQNQNRTWLVIISAFFMAFGALAKLPFIVYYSLPLILLLKKLMRKDFGSKELPSLCISFIFYFLPVLWYIWVIPSWEGNAVAHGLFSNTYDLLVLLDYLQHNLISSLPELLLGFATLPFFLLAFYYISRNRSFQSERFFFLASAGILLMLYYFYEINLIGKVHDYYLLPFMPLLFILVSYGALNLYSQGKKWIYVTTFLILLMPGVAWLRMKGRWDENKPGFNKDLYIHRDELKAIGNKKDLCIVGNDESRSIWLYHLDKKGWCFSWDNFDAKKMEVMIENGAKYLISDSELINSDTLILQQVDSIIGDYGSITVFSLKEKSIALP